MKKYFEGEYKAKFFPWVILTFLCAFLIMIAGKMEFSGYLGAQYTAFIQNLMMSVLFIQMLKKLNSTKAQSITIAFAKMIGTLAPTMLVYFAKGSLLLQALGLCIFLFDLVYIYLLWKFSKI